jgi:hypothetical protein
VLIHLAGNAVKFSSAQARAGRISLRARAPERSAQQVLVEFSVADNGIGIDAASLPILFTAFTQADAGTICARRWNRAARPDIWRQSPRCGRGSPPKRRPSTRSWRRTRA